MNEFKKEDLIFGSTIVPETYWQYVDIPLTKKEKRKIFIYEVKEMIIKMLCFVFLIIGIDLQIIGLAYLAGAFFKMGAS